MGENDAPSIFDDHINGYLEQIARLDFGLLTERLGAAVSGNAAVVPLLGRLRGQRGSVQIPAAMPQCSSDG
jgi:hypothetical protein